MPQHQQHDDNDNDDDDDDRNDSSPSLPNSILQSIEADWTLYFPFDAFDRELPWTQAALLFREYLTTDGKTEIENVNLERVTEVVFDLESFCSHIEPTHSMSGFRNVLLSNASMTLNCLGLALCSLRQQADQQADGVTSPMRNKIIPRFVNLRPLTGMRDLMSSFLGRLVSIRGTVVRVSGVKPLVKRMDFLCPKCEQLLTKNMPDGRMENPTHCETPECKGRIFKPELASAVTVDWQRIRVQELDDGIVGGLSHGAIPRSIDVELTDELVDTVVPGDVVTLVGIVRAINAESIRGVGSRCKGKNREASLLEIFIEANAIETKSLVFRGKEKQVSEQEALLQLTQGSSTASYVASQNTMSTSMSVAPCFEKLHHRAGDQQIDDVVANLTAQDIKTIKQIARDHDIAYLVRSFCPLILGHEHVKAGFLLALAGGTRAGNSEESSSVVEKRADIHIMVVGDPGLGKSQMLKFAASLSSRGIYVCGNTATKSGLTVTMSKDGNGDHCLEAGALVMADRGVCCIDEFDKISVEQAALLEAMEQQSISIAKAGIVCNLRARNSVLAAANPKDGHYNPAKSLLDNLKMSPPLLSRFDVIFLLLDKPEQEHDNNIADYVIGMHLKNKRQKKDHSTSSQIQNTEDMSFRERLKAATMSAEKPLPEETLRKYIAYVRHFCAPKLSRAACHKLQQFYLELRNNSKGGNSTPITTRQLESLIRLSQARAKLELRQIVTERDVSDIISLMREALADVCSSEIVLDDICRSSKGMSKTKVYRALVKHLVKTAQDRGNAKFTVAELRAEAQRVKLLQYLPNFNETLDILNQQCYLLQKGNGVYQVNISEY